MKQNKTKQNKTKQNKTFKIILTLCCFLAFSVNALASAPQNPPIPGIGVVVKKNPGGGASKATTGKDGSFSLELAKGSYLVSLNQEQLMKVGQELVKIQNPKSNYLFNGDGTQLVIADNENIIMSQLEGDVNSDLILITALKPTTLQGSLLWDSSVVNQPQEKNGPKVGHVTIIKRNASQSLQVFCPTGTVGLGGKCVPIKELENTPVGKSEAYVGHVTLLRKNSSAMKVAETEGGPISGQVVKGGTNGGTHKVKRTGHVTLLRFSKPLIYIGGGITSPSSTTKEAGVVNGIDINLSVYKPIWFWGNTSLGINAGGGYTTGNGDYALDNRYTVYQLQGQSAPPTVSEKGSGSPKNAGFKFEAGPQMNIHLGDVTVSPILNAAYLSISQKAFAVTETVQENTVDYPYVLLAQKATKTSGLGIIPKVRVAYNITPSIGIWVEGSYIMGPKIETESTRFVLDPNIPSDSYNLGHFNEGQYITTKSDSKYSAVGVSGGIVISLGRIKNSENNPITNEPNTPINAYHTQEFNGGCTRTCTGDWSVNKDFTVYTCDGTAGPLVCNGMGNTVLTTNRVIADKVFDKYGEVYDKKSLKIQEFFAWGKTGHWCNKGGIYCYGKTKIDIQGKTSSNTDETVAETSIKLNDKNIVITSISQSGSVSKETLESFKNKKVERTIEPIPSDYYKELLNSVGLLTPKENIVFTPENQSYEVVNTTNEGKPVQIIEVTQKTKINIDGKEYNLIVITTSGKGSGSPKNQGF